jgi:hypothetical protein
MMENLLKGLVSLILISLGVVLDRIVAYPSAILQLVGYTILITGTLCLMWACYKFIK